MMKKGSKAAPPPEPGPTSPDVEQALGADIPPPEQPLDPGAAASYVRALNDAFTALMPGEELPEVAFEATGPVEDFPDDVKARTKALAVFLQQSPAGAKYALDPAATLTSDAGLTEGASMLVQLSGDQRTLASLQRTPKPSKPEPEPTPPKKDSLNTGIGSDVVFNTPISDDDRKTAPRDMKPPKKPQRASKFV
jgi:hypothetical protein